MGSPSARPSDLSIPFRAIKPGTHCVDDAASPWYNRIVDEDEVPGFHAGLWKSSERMWLETDRYRLLLLVDYNTMDPKPGNGSCIFMHIWLGEGRATTGCTAMAAKDLEDLLTWLKPETHPELVQLPREAYHRVWRQWRLPAPELLERTDAMQ
jgi:L,D-peptidoglycan transpeptidase YkuD (ErfK/YbiS/YcfS/YnhG family)